MFFLIQKLNANPGRVIGFIETPKNIKLAVHLQLEPENLLKLLWKCNDDSKLKCVLKSFVSFFFRMAGSSQLVSSQHVRILGR